MKPILGTMTFSDQVDQSTAAEMITAFKQARHREVDTAYVYAGGNTESLLGRLQKDGVLDDCIVAGKVNPLVENGLQPIAVDHQITTSLERLNLENFDLFYLHQPDLDTSIERTLEAVFRHFQAGRFKRFGLSNYAAWQVAEITEMCKVNGWMQPVVYQGMYNAITRDVERELFPCLRHYGINFYVYNPLAGGLLSGKHAGFDSKPADGRFGTNEQYQDRYWKSEFFPVVTQFAQTCQAHDVAPASAALRWLVHHSALSSDVKEHGFDHSIVLGASSMTHFSANLAACADGPLPDAIVQVLDDGWETVRPWCIKYFRP